MSNESRKQLAATLFASALALGTTITSHAQTGMTQPAATRAASQPISGEMRARQVIGKDVRNQQGENLGKVDDLIIDMNGERVYYALVSFGGIMGVGDKKFVFPVGSFQSAGNDLVLNVDKDALKKAPGFDSQRRPGMSSNNFYRDVDRFYKIEGGQQLPKEARLVSANDLIGSKVNDHGQHNAGKIEDLVVNFGTGRTYAVLGVDESWSPKSKLVALPLNAFHVPNRPGVPIMLNVDRPSIETARGFDNNTWPDLNSANYQREVSDQLLSFQTKIKRNPAETQSGRETASGASK